MEKYYKITAEEAALIGKFEYAPNQVIDPFVGEQKDGTYLVSEKMYLILQHHPKIEAIDFGIKPKTDKEDLDPKDNFPKPVISEEPK